MVTGTRAEYGLLRNLIEQVQSSEFFTLDLIATGAHLSPEFGTTIREIEADGFTVTRKVEMLSVSDSSTGVSKSVGLGLISFADCFEDLKPDLIIILGDRYEMLAAATAALIAKIPIAHIHGGEITEGAIDDAIRHAITKMANIHFVSTQRYLERVIQMGEQPNTVFNVGGMGVDNIRRTKLIEKENLEIQLGLKFAPKTALVTLHPSTLSNENSVNELDALLSALEMRKEFNIIFTLPNADAGGRLFKSKIEKFCEERESARYFSSLGYQRYLSCIAYCDVVVGNSSSGLLEAPSFKKSTINIGDRQLGREKAQSIIDCMPTTDSIMAAFEFQQTHEHREKLKGVVNPYGEGGASVKILKLLQTNQHLFVIRKRFRDN